MLILFDHGAPQGLIRALPDHTVITAKARGWDRLSNGALLNAAEEAAVDLLLTTDRRIRYQQNLTGRKIAIVVLAGSTKWLQVQLHVERIAAVVNAVEPGSYTEVENPLRLTRPYFLAGACFAMIRSLILSYVACGTIFCCTNWVLARYGRPAMIFAE